MISQNANFMKGLLFIECLLLKVMVRLDDCLEKKYIKYENLKPMGKVETEAVGTSSSASEF